MNKIAYVAIIHQTRVTFACGIVSDMSDENRAKLVKHILCQTGIKFSSLMTADLESDLRPIIYADDSDEIYLSLEKTMNLQ